MSDLRRLADFENNTKDQELDNNTDAFDFNASGGLMVTSAAAPGPRRLRGDNHGNHSTLAMVAGLLLPASICAYPACMVPGRPGQLNPPSWGPDQRSYPFRTWTRDVLIWSVAVSDWDPSRKAASLAMRLTGPAQDYVRAMPPATLINGGMINGVQTDPLTYLIHSLCERFGQLGEEQQLSAMTELMTFTRHQNERIDALLARFDQVRQRARDTGGLMLNIEGMAWVLLRAVGVNDSQLLTLLQPTQGRFPRTVPELDALQVLLRRMGHVLEHSPGNLAAALGRGGPPRGHFFMGEQQPETQHPAQDGWGSYDDWTGQSGRYQQLPSEPAYLGSGADDVDSGTDSDTASSLGESTYDLSTADIPAEMRGNESAVAQSLFWAYERAKKAWRSFMQKPTRRVRRYLKKKGYTKGKGKYGGKRAGQFLADLSEEQTEGIFAGFRKGKGKGNSGRGKGAGGSPADGGAHMANRSTGKGKGRDRNPIGPDGQVMKCHGCSSEYHLWKDCTQRPAGNAQPIHYTSPLAGIVPAASRPAEAMVLMASVESDITISSSWDRVSVPTAGAGRGTASTQQPIPPFPFPAAYQVGAGIGPPADDDAVMTPAGPQAQEDPFQQADPWPTMPQQQQPLLQENVQRDPWRWFQPLRSIGRGISAATSQIGYRVDPPPGFEAESLPSTINVSEQDIPAPERDEQPPADEQVPMRSYLESTAVQPNYTLWPGMEVTPEGSTIPDQPNAVLRRSDYSTNMTSEQRMVLETLHQTSIRYHLPRELPTPQTNSGDAHVILYQEFHQTQQEGIQIAWSEREARRYRQTKGKGKGDGTSVDGAEVEYDGMDTSCSICLEDFVRGEHVVRLRCHHLFHTDCWTEQLVADQRPTCPNCRGTGTVIARFRFIMPDPGTPPGTPQPPTPREFGTPESSYPWWIGLAATELQEGLSILVDPGAYTNLCGEQWARRAASLALGGGFTPSEKRMAKPLSVHGVGNGSNTAEWQLSLPITLTDTQQTTTVHSFEAPIVAQGGSELPALLGLGSLQAKNAIMDMNATAPRLIFPGNTPPEINVGPGSTILPLKAAPSGHLCIQVGNYSRLSEQGGLRQQQMSLLTADHPAGEVSSASSSSERSPTRSQTPSPQVAQSPGQSQDHSGTESVDSSRRLGLPVPAAAGPIGPSAELRNIRTVRADRWINAPLPGLRETVWVTDRDMAARSRSRDEPPPAPNEPAD